MDAVPAINRINGCDLQMFFRPNSNDRIETGTSLS